MLNVAALSGTAGSPTSSPVAARAAQSVLNRFGPSSVIGGKPKSVFVVYTARGRHPGPSTVDRKYGAIAQLGERYNGIVEVTGSIPVGSTNSMKGLDGSG